MLTIKREKFCNEFVLSGNKSEAYRAAFNAENMQPATIHSRASELMKNGMVRARVDELQVAIAEKNGITADDLLQELEQARQLALMTRQPSAMITATMGKARILGFNKIILSGDKDDPLQFKMNQMSDADLMEEAGRIAKRLGEMYSDFTG
jgi:hypothetical protein